MILRVIIGTIAICLIMLATAQQSPASYDTNRTDRPLMTIKSQQGKLTRDGAAYSLVLTNKVRLLAADGTTVSSPKATAKGDANGLREARISNADTMFTMFQQENGKQVEYQVHITAGLLEITEQGRLMKFSVNEEKKNRPLVVMTPLDGNEGVKYDFSADTITLHPQAEKAAQNPANKSDIEYLYADGNINFHAKYLESNGMVQTTQQGEAQYLTMSYEKSTLISQSPLLVTLGSKGKNEISLKMRRKFMQMQDGKIADNPTLQDEITTLGAQTVMIRRSAPEEVAALAKTLGAGKYEERNYLVLSGKVHCVITRGTPLTNGQLMTIPVPEGPQEWNIRAEQIRLAARATRYKDEAPSYDYWVHMDRGENEKGVQPYIGVKDLLLPNRPDRYLSGDPTLSFGVTALLGAPPLGKGN